MQIFGFTLTRTKSLRNLTSPSRVWWPWIQEVSAGGFQRNEEIKVGTVLNNPTLYACITLIAGDIAKLRPKLVQRDEHGIWHEVSKDSPFLPVLQKPNPYQGRIDFFEWWMLSKLCHGNTYALKARDIRGMVRHLFILDPHRVTPLLAPDGSVFYELAQDDLNRIGESIVVPAREIIHDVMCPLFHPLVGVSPIYAAGFPALQGLNIRHASDKFFVNGSRPGGILTAPAGISTERANEMKAYWEQEFSGDNTGKIAVLSGDLKYQPMGMSAEDSKLVEQLRMSDEDIAKCFHMPRHKVGIGPDPTQHNIENLNRQYYSDCLQKQIEKLEESLDWGLGLVDVPGKTLGVELEREALFEMDTAAKSDAATKAIGSGMAPNEVRKRYHELGPVEGGDAPFLQQQYWPISQLAQREDTPQPPQIPPTAPSRQPAQDDDAEKSVNWSLVKRLLRTRAA